MKKLGLFLVLLQATFLCPTLTYAQSLDSNFIQFSHFIADNSTMKCWADEHVTPFNEQVRGACLGGWLVLEPWITPSLFYQFLGKHENNTAVDMYSFCNVLGPEEGNKQLRRHWDAWVTEDHIRELVEEGSVNSLRLPVGDWMYKPYGKATLSCIFSLIIRFTLTLLFLNNLFLLKKVHLWVAQMEPLIMLIKFWIGLVIMAYLF